MRAEKLGERRREIRELKEALIKENDEGQLPPNSEQMQASSLDELSPKPYSIEFYQERLMQLEMNQFISQELNPEPQLDSMIELTFDDDDEEEEVDRYLNLEEGEELNLH